jgi:thioredoxin 1
MDALADQYAGRIKFVKVNVDESPKLAQQFQVAAIPTLLFFKDGKLTQTSVGLVSKADLIGRLDILLQTNATSATPGR